MASTPAKVASGLKLVPGMYQTLTAYQYKPTAGKLPRLPKGPPSDNTLRNMQLKQIAKSVSLKPVRGLSATFDPFREASSLREFLHWVTLKKVSRTNDTVTMRIDVKCDRSEPYLQIDFLNGDRVLLYTNQFALLDIAKIFHGEVARRFVAEAATKAPEVPTAPGGKKPAGGKGKK